MSSFGSFSPTSIKKKRPTTTATAGTGTTAAQPEYTADSPVGANDTTAVLTQQPAAPIPTSNPLPAGVTTANLTQSSPTLPVGTEAAKTDLKAPEGVGNPLVKPPEDGAATTPAEKTGATPAVDQRSETEKLYSDLLKSHEGSWGDKQKALADEGAKMQRQNAEINARMGRNIGGGFAGGMAQAVLGAQQLMLDERTRHDDKARDYQMKMIDASQKDRYRSEDQEFEREMQATNHANQRELTELALGEGPPTQQEQLASDFNTFAMSNFGATEEQAKRAYEDHFKVYGRYPTTAKEKKDALGLVGVGPHTDWQRQAGMPEDVAEEHLNRFTM